MTANGLPIPPQSSIPEFRDTGLPGISTSLPLPLARRLAVTLEKGIALLERLISEELRRREFLVAIASIEPTDSTEMMIKQSDRLIATYQMLIEQGKNLKANQ